MLARGAEADVAAWSETARLNPAGGAMSRLDDPDVASAYVSLAANLGAAIENLERKVGSGTPVA